MGALLLISKILSLQSDNELMTSEATQMTPVIIQVSGTSLCFVFPCSSKVPSNSQPGTQDVSCATAFSLILFPVSVSPILPSQTQHLT